jgi:ribA/ribD-fused uncharacterized protein
MSKTKIKSFSGEYKFLSNFAFIPGGILSPEDGIRYRTVEHAYQAAKTHDKFQKNIIKQCSTPKEAKKIGRSLDLRDDWKFIREGVMKSLLIEKFKIDEFRKQLLDTKNSKLIEGNTWGDRFWGVYKGKGQNKLGDMLMRVRDEIKI